MNYTDDEVLSAIRNGKNQEAISFFYADFWPEIRRYFSKRGANEQEAEEVYHHAILKFLEQVKRGKYDTKKGKGIRGFIFTICKNHWIDMKKKAQRERAVSNDESQETLVQVIDEDIPETKNVIRKLFSEVGEKCERLLDHFFYDGFSMKDIAGKLGLANESAAKMQKLRCMKKLIGILKSSPGTEKMVMELLRA